MGIGHDQAMRANAGQSGALCRTTVNGDVLANDRMSPDHAACRLTAIFEILRREAYRYERVNLDMRADLCDPVDNDAGMKSDTLAKRHVGAN
ncbi:hypothetical protein AA0535_2677 [Asaia krungthepensis NRIC 0535]|uniref:Uncharacterized protein n=1 Tax=Asaia krungthepensis NRIC 0535 TaxID=1307925 RepID=A0ABQ0Q5W9_9PROT|nr:hypothetical protein AA0535_2677 [Asaia krungthepensis NRIC 0535]